MGKCSGYWLFLRRKFYRSTYRINVRIRGRKDTTTRDGRCQRMVLVFLVLLRDGAQSVHGRVADDNCFRVQRHETPTSSSASTNTLCATMLSSVLTARMKMGPSACFIDSYVQSTSAV